MRIYFTDFSWILDGGVKTAREAEKEAVGLILRRASADLNKSEVFDLKYLDSGKPYIDGTEISISHSGSFAAAAFSDKPVGIDIQTVSEVKERVMKRCFSPEEIKRVNNSLCPKKTFTEIWTVKEANYKLSGNYKEASEHKFTLETESFVLTAVGEGAEKAEIFVI